MRNANATRTREGHWWAFDGRLTDCVKSLFCGVRWALIPAHRSLETVLMLTFASILEATQQMGVHGEERTGALDHLPKKLKGPRAQRRRTASAPKSQGDAGVRCWDEASGTYVYRYD